MFSDNRPELALPYFPIIEQMVELGKWRTSVDWMPRAGKCSLPGAFTNYFVSDCCSTDPSVSLLTRGCRREQGKWPDPDGLRATPRGEAGTPGNNTKLAGINFPGHFSAFPEIYYP